MAANTTEILKQLQQYRTEAERAQGVASVAIANLKTLGYESREEAEKALAASEAELAEEEEKFAADYAAFQAKWREQLG